MCKVYRHKESDRRQQGKTYASRHCEERSVVAIQKCLINQRTGLPHKETPTCYGVKPMQDRMPRFARNDKACGLFRTSLDEMECEEIPG